VVNEYTWGPGGMVHSSNPNTLYVLGTGRRSNGQYRWFQLDWLGSTRSLTDAAGSTTSKQRYEAFGSRSAKTGTDPFHPSDFQWGGGWGYQTETAFSNEPGLGLNYIEQRYYDPLVGRFLSPDPISYLGGLNLYDYVDNDPVNRVDPNGLDDADHILPDNPRVQEPWARDYLGTVHRGAGYAREGIEFAGSFNVVTNGGLALNDLGEGNYWGAALRLSGPLLKLFGRFAGRARVA
jgi:RHS repeat-associated protein